MMEKKFFSGEVKDDRNPFYYTGFRFVVTDENGVAVAYCTSKVYADVIADRFNKENPEVKE
jgi:hypothetical protein